MRISGIKPIRIISNSVQWQFQMPLESAPNRQRYFVWWDKVGFYLCFIHLLALFCNTKDTSGRIYKLFKIELLPDTLFRPTLWDLLELQLLRPDSSILPCLYSTFHLENPLVLSRFCLNTVDYTCISYVVLTFQKKKHVCQWNSNMFHLAASKNSQNMFSALFG